MNMDYLYKIKNGNYLVKIFNKNIRLRETNDDILIPQFPEFYNFIINEYNFYGYIKHSNVFKYNFINDILKFSEVSIYGYDVLQHPQLMDFLTFLNNKKCYIKLYVNQNILNNKNIEYINDLHNNNLIKELHINNINVNNNLIKLLEEYKYFYCDIIINDISFNKLCKLKDFKIIIKSINDNNNLKNITKNLDYIINNFKNINFDNNSIIKLNLIKYMGKDLFSKNIEIYNNQEPELDIKSILSYDNFFSIIFNLVNNNYYKSFNSNTYYNIDNNDTLENMYKIIKNS